MSKFPHAPAVVVAHYRELLEGVRWEGPGVVRITKSHSEDDETTMRRLLEAPVMAKPWKQLQGFLADAELVRFFGCAWTTALDYDRFRFVGTTRRKAELTAAAEEIKNTTNRIFRLLERARRLGNTPARDPDQAMDSPGLQRELAALLDRAERFDPSYPNTAGFVNAALARQERSPAREYLRALITLLAETGLPLERRGVPAILAAVAEAATGEGISDREARKVLAEMSLRSPKKIKK